MRRALECGADIVNDIVRCACPVRSGPVAAIRLRRLPDACAAIRPPCCSRRPAYDVVTEVSDFLHAEQAGAASRGIGERIVLVDPGIQFAKGRNRTSR